MDFVLGACNIDPQAAEFLGAGRDNNSRIVVKLGVSQIGAAPFLEIPTRFSRESIELSCRDIILKLTIPSGGVKLCEPCSKDSKLLF